MDPRSKSGVRSAVIAYALWGSLTAFWKLLNEFSAVDLIGWRVIAAVIVLWLLVTSRGQMANVVTAIRDPSVRRFLLLAAGLLVVNWSTYVGAIVSGRVLETALGYFLAPLITMTIGVTLLGERLTPMRMLAIVLVITSISILTVSYGQIPWLSFALGGSWAFYGLVKRRVPLDPIDSLTGEVTTLLPIAVVVVIISLTRSGGVGEIATGFDWVLLAATGLVTAAPLLLFAHAAPRVPFTLLGPIGWMVPVINFLLGWLAYGETMTPARFIGFAFVWLALVAVAVETVLRARNERSQKQPGVPLAR
jgi:chloramphenicol-sensitive protein RarD